jgi:hypothetical protein
MGVYNTSEWPPRTPYQTGWGYIILLGCFVIFLYFFCTFYILFLYFFLFLYLFFLLFFCLFFFFCPLFFCPVFFVHIIFCPLKKINKKSGRESKDMTPPLGVGPGFTPPDHRVGRIVTSMAYL